MRSQTAGTNGTRQSRLQVHLQILRPAVEWPDANPPLSLALDCHATHGAGSDAAFPYRAAATGVQYAVPNLSTASMHIRQVQMECGCGNQLVRQAGLSSDEPPGSVKRPCT